MTIACGKCGAPTEAGVTTALGLVGHLATTKREPRLVFIAPGTPTSPNPLKAVAQGIAGEPSDAGYLIRARRCTRCGFVELYATERVTV